MTWMQKSRANWYIQGERNTRYFHLTTKKMRARNKIISIKRMDGQVTEDEKEIEEAFLANFKEIYCTGDTANKDQIIVFLQMLSLPKITKAQLMQLNAPFKEDEERANVGSDEENSCSDATETKRSMRLRPRPVVKTKRRRGKQADNICGDRSAPGREDGLYGVSVKEK
ncbi:hypothetical protein COLO4_10359 [Corchorus olitorius]|uniref:Uncharacterized protein n=1 Tax=Corchorus olitorius TaxID=93759 RepID=A0A1R3K8W0_9ROSI|nr:hypothetical protein COLO4_10359 [Corchorus olitorius]